MDYKEANRRIMKFNATEDNFIKWRRRYVGHFDNNIEKCYKMMRDNKAYLPSFELFLAETMMYHQGINVIDIERIRRKYCGK